jgi:hypothetical protein
MGKKIFILLFLFGCMSNKENVSEKSVAAKQTASDSGSQKEDLKEAIKQLKEDYQEELFNLREEFKLSNADEKAIILEEIQKINKQLLDQIEIEKNILRVEYANSLNVTKESIRDEFEAKIESEKTLLSEKIEDIKEELILADKEQSSVLLGKIDYLKNEIKTFEENVSNSLEQQQSSLENKIIALEEKLSLSDENLKGFLLNEIAKAKDEVINLLEVEKQILVDEIAKKASSEDVSALKELLISKIEEQEQKSKDLVNELKEELENVSLIERRKLENKINLLEDKIVTYQEEVNIRLSNIEVSIDSLKKKFKKRITALSKLIKKERKARQKADKKIKKDLNKTKKKFRKFKKQYRADLRELRKTDRKLSKQIKKQSKNLNKKVKKINKKYGKILNKINVKVEDLSKDILANHTDIDAVFEYLDDKIDSLSSVSEESYQNLENLKLEIDSLRVNNASFYQEVANTYATKDSLKESIAYSKELRTAILNLDLKINSNYDKIVSLLGDNYYRIMQEIEQLNSAFKSHSIDLTQLKIQTNTKVEILRDQISNAIDSGESSVDEVNSKIIELSLYINNIVDEINTKIEDSANDLETDLLQAQLKEIIDYEQETRNLLSNKLNAIDKKIIELENDQEIEVVQLCTEKKYSEILLRLEDGTLLAHYASGSKQFLTKIGPGYYRTTDGYKCSFRVHPNGEVTW